MNGAARDSDESHDLSCLLMHRFNEYIKFTPSEVMRIRALGEKPIALPRSAVIREQEVRPTCVYILVDGWAAASVVYESGNRQITKVHLPGDLMGVSSACLDLTAECLTALTPVVASRVPLERFGRLFAESPRFAAAMFLSSQRERIALIDAMSRIGRTTSAERLAALLLDLHERLSRVSHACDLRLETPITQEDFADILGMTPVHVNRCFKKLQNLGSIRRFGKRIEILDPHALAKFARWSPRSVASKLDWLIEPTVPELSGPRA